MPTLCAKVPLSKCNSRIKPKKTADGKYLWCRKYKSSKGTTFCRATSAPVTRTNLKVKARVRTSAGNTRLTDRAVYETQSGAQFYRMKVGDTVRRVYVRRGTPTTATTGRKRRRT